MIPDHKVADIGYSGQLGQEEFSESRHKYEINTIAGPSAVYHEKYNIKGRCKPIKRAWRKFGNFIETGVGNLCYWGFMSAATLFIVGAVTFLADDRIRKTNTESISDVVNYNSIDGEVDNYNVNVFGGLKEDGNRPLNVTMHLKEGYKGPFAYISTKDWDFQNNDGFEEIDVRRQKGDAYCQVTHNSIFKRFKFKHWGEQLPASKLTRNEFETAIRLVNRAVNEVYFPGIFKKEVEKIIDEREKSQESNKGKKINEVELHNTPLLWKDPRSEWVGRK